MTCDRCPPHLSRSGYFLFLEGAISVRFTCRQRPRLLDSAVVLADSVMDASKLFTSPIDIHGFP